MTKHSSFICSKCGKYDVPHRNGRKECKRCEGEYVREWKKNRPQKQEEYNKKIAIKRRGIKKLCVQYLGGACQYPGGCATPLREGMKPCWLVFHFHHIDPATKLFEISRRSRHGGTSKSIKSIANLKKVDPGLIEELDKCILLCANCHHRLENCDCPGCKRSLSP